VFCLGADIGIQKLDCVRKLRFRYGDSCAAASAGLFADYYFYVAVERIEEMH